MSVYAQKLRPETRQKTCNFTKLDCNWIQRKTILKNKWRKGLGSARDETLVLLHREVIGKSKNLVGSVMYYHRLQETRRWLKQQPQRTKGSLQRAERAIGGVRWESGSDHQPLLLKPVSFPGSLENSYIDTNTNCKIHTPYKKNRIEDLKLRFGSSRPTRITYGPNYST